MVPQWTLPNTKQYAKNIGINNDWLTTKMLEDIRLNIKFHRNVLTDSPKSKSTFAETTPELNAYIFLISKTPAIAVI